MARRLLALIFVGALAKAIADATRDPGWWAKPRPWTSNAPCAPFRRSPSPLWWLLFLVYSIPFGRNLKGILAWLWTFHRRRRDVVYLRAIWRRSFSRFLVLSESRFLRLGPVSLGCVFMEPASSNLSHQPPSVWKSSISRSPLARAAGWRTSPRIPGQGDGSMMPGDPLHRVRRVAHHFFVAALEEYSRALKQDCLSMRHSPMTKTGPPVPGNLSAALFSAAKIWNSSRSSIPRPSRSYS